ncbi:MAG: hypothetical protein AB2A00_32600 [Myxococcota bacterium]
MAADCPRRGARAVLCAALVCLALDACGSQGCPHVDLPEIEAPDASVPSLWGTEEPVQDVVVVQGIVNRRPAGGGQPSPLRGATVTMMADVDGNGTYQDGEWSTVFTDREGRYRAQLLVPAGTLLVVTYRGEGVAPLYRTVTAAPRANIKLTVTLTEMQVLECRPGACAIPGHALQLRGVPDGLSGSARVFNPVEEPNVIPGHLEDAERRVLLTAVFAFVELKGEDGQELNTVDPAVDLQMRVPRQSWRLLRDMSPGTPRVEVPLYRFDAWRGQWLREGEGYLVDEDGLVLPEQSLAAIHDGTWSNGVAVRGSVGRTGYWNVDWAVPEIGCLTGRVLGRDGLPAEGATVSARGSAYVGASRATTVLADGRFCVEVLRSDRMGEDLDQDGFPNERHRVALRFAHRGLVYDAREHEPSSVSATCGGGCADLGTIVLSQDNELVPRICEVHGVLVDRRGELARGVSVFGWDATLDVGQWTLACSLGDVTCEFLTRTDAEGTFMIRTAMLDELNVLAASSGTVATGHESARSGTMLLRSCPAEPVQLVLDSGMDVYDVDVHADGDVITWEPPLRVTQLDVRMGNGRVKWSVTANGPGFLPPVRYGVVPDGALGYSSSDAGPGSLSSGDEVEVFLGGRGEEGYPYQGRGELDVE